MKTMKTLLVLSLASCLLYVAIQSSNIQLDFICQTSGMYPDLFNCRMYHYCVQLFDKVSKNMTLKHFTSTCAYSYSYNLNTTFCDIPVNHNGSCPSVYPVVDCSTSGQTGNVKSNPTLYYICRYHPKDYKLLYPFIYACENGRIYNPSTYICH